MKVRGRVLCIPFAAKFSMGAAILDSLDTYLMELCVCQMKEANTLPHQQVPEYFNERISLENYRSCFWPLRRFGLL